LASRVAGAGHETLGKISTPFLPTDMKISKSELSSFLLNNKASQPIKLLEPSVSDSHSSENRTLSSCISLVAEIILD
jgi:hypothetical protein